MLPRTLVTIHRTLVDLGGPTVSASPPPRGCHPSNRTADGARLNDLLTRSANCDTTAFAALYDETASQAFGLALRLLRDPNLAEDAVQEAYLTIWRKSAGFDPLKGSSRSWIYMIVHRTAVDLIRSAEARSARDLRHALEHSALHRSSDTDDPTHDLNASYEASVVRAALAGLPTQQREPLELSFYDGYTYREVAELLGIPLGTAKTRIRAGLMALQETMTLQTIQATRNADYDSGPNLVVVKNLGPDRRRQSRKR